MLSVLEREPEFGLEQHEEEDEDAPASEPEMAEAAEDAEAGEPEQLVFTLGRPGGWALPDMGMLNAPQIKNNSGTHDRLVRIDLEKRTATFKMTDGFFEGRRVHYTSFNASDPAIAALEAANYTPNLKALPNKGSNGPASGLTGLAPVVNGPTGKGNPHRQGLSSALMGEGDPLNIVQEIPAGPRALAYSPMWDVHATVWAQVAMPASNSITLKDFNEVEKKAYTGQISGPDGKPWGPIGVVVNCPIISLEE